MDFGYTEEQIALRDTARDWLAARYPADRLIAIADDLSGPGGDHEAWQQIEKLGWLDAAAEGAVETGLLLQECGRALLPAPFFVTVGLASAFGVDTLHPTTLAYVERGAHHLTDNVTAAVDADGLVTGCKLLVPDVGTTSRAVVTTQSGPRLVAIEDARVVAHSTVDRTRRLGDLLLEGTPSEPVPVSNLTRVRAWILAACANEAVGVAERVLEIATTHASTRMQFGRVIGTYQAVSHQLADCYVATELARSLAIWASWALDADDPSAFLAAAAAKADAGAAAVKACEAAIQVHGGIGFTWDSILHRYYKRAQFLDAFEGSAARQRGDIAATILSS